MDEYLQHWQQIIATVQQNLSFDDETKATFNNLEVCKVEKNTLYILVEDALTKYRLERFYAPKIVEISESLTNEKLRFKFVIKEELEENEKNEAPFITPPQHPVGRKISSIYTFSNFEIGESNRFAYLSAMKTAESNAEKIYNPLYIFGDVGLGKTHLMTAIGNYILDNDPSVNVVYVSTQKFTEDYFLATTGRRGKDGIEDFYNKYNSADILLVDDIQFLEGKTATQKTATQEEFFKIFENLVQQNKQIVITSDRPANDLKNVMTRLKSRFNWGVAVNIKHPDKNLRIKILKSKLKMLIKDPEDVSEDILGLLADFFPTNIRDLEGALRSYVTYCICMNSSFSVENLYIALENIIPKEQPQTSENIDIIENVKEKTCEYFKISLKDLTSTSRKQQFAYARQVVMYILRSKFNIPLKTIGDNVGGRDHATVAHAVDRIANQIKSNQLVKADIDEISKKVKG